MSQCDIVRIISCLSATICGFEFALQFSFDPVRGLLACIRYETRRYFAGSGREDDQDRAGGHQRICRRAHRQGVRFARRKHVVEVYGSQMRIRELAGITTPEPRMLVLQPWDMNSLHPIEKAIQKANLGPVADDPGQNHPAGVPGIEPGTAAGIRQTHQEKWPRTGAWPSGTCAATRWNC
jgi:hypothetical protein